MPRLEPQSENEQRTWTGFLSRLVRNEKTWTALMAGAALVALFLPLIRSDPAPQPLAKKRAPHLARVSKENVPLVTGEESISEIFRRAGCSVCHTIPGIEGAEGRVGPKLLLGSTGPQRLEDPAYQGDAETVREYVIESVLHPGAYVVPGYPDKTMPAWYGQKLTAQALGKMAAYLEGVTGEGEPPTVGESEGGGSGPA